MVTFQIQTVDVMLVIVKIIGVVITVNNALLIAILDNIIANAQPVFAQLDHIIHQKAIVPFVN